MRCSSLCFASFSSRWALAKGFSLSFMVSYCRETHPVEASWAVGLSRRLRLRSLLRLRSRLERSLLERSLDRLRERSRRRRPILAPLCYAAPRARVQHSHSRAALKASCSVRRCLFRRADQLVGFAMANSDDALRRAKAVTRARGLKAMRPVLASVFQDASSYRVFPRQLREVRMETKPPRLSGSLEGLALVRVPFQTPAGPRLFWAATRANTS